LYLWIQQLKLHSAELAANAAAQEALFHQAKPGCMVLYNGGKAAYHTSLTPLNPHALSGVFIIQKSNLQFAAS
jgi:hypothetical protein